MTEAETDGSWVERTISYTPSGGSGAWLGFGLAAVLTVLAILAALFRNNFSGIRLSIFMILISISDILPEERTKVAGIVRTAGWLYALVVFIVLFSRI